MGVKVRRFLKRKNVMVLALVILVPFVVLLVFHGRILLTPKQESFAEDYVYLEESTDMGRSQFQRNIVFQDGRL